MFGSVQSWTIASDTIIPESIKPAHLTAHLSGVYSFAWLPHFYHVNKLKQGVS
jgi:hypothetical protein